MASLTKKFFARYVRLSERHPALLVAFFFLLFVTSVFFAMRLELHTAFDELLPPNHPAVLALQRVAGRQKSATNLVMLVASADKAANRRFADALRPQLEPMIPRTFSEIQWVPNTEIPDYGERYKWLYAPLPDLEHAEELLDRVISKRSSPLAVDIDDDPEVSLKKLRTDLNAKVPVKPVGIDAGPLTHFEYFDAAAKRYYLGVMMWRRSDGLATRGDHETLAAVKDVVAKLKPSTFAPDMKVEYTGGIAQAIDEQNGIRDDLTFATAVVGTLVLFVIWLYFRRVGLLLVIGAPAVLGLFVALAFASWKLKYLNINTAFLISIILGNGINSPIILLGRYGEERRHGRVVANALNIAMNETLAGTLAAMAAASIAYGSLMLTSFRGFSQFGLLGGVGMLLVWIFSFLLVPPLVILGERWKPGALTPRDNLLRRPFAFIGTIGSKRPRLLALVVLALVGATLPPVWRYMHDPLEWNINNLRTDETPSGRLWPMLDKLGMGNVGAGYIGNNGVLLVDKPTQADTVADALFAADQQKGPSHTLKAVHTLNRALPDHQDEKIDILNRLRRKIDKHRALMDDDEEKEIVAWRPPEYLQNKLQVADLPRQIREAFTETDGQVGRLIGIDADYANYQDWEGHNLIRMARNLTVDALGQQWTAYSAATVFAGMLETLISDGPLVSLAALLGVGVLILLVFGWRGAMPVALALGVGVLWWGGLLARLPLKLNFMNFVALPITLGVGADYAANIWARLRKGGRIADGIADTGSAVALCSMTTIIGYSSLLLSHNRALRSFGLAADLGEITCLGAALLVLPAVVRLLRARRHDQSIAEVVAPPDQPDRPEV